MSMVQEAEGRVLRWLRLIDRLKTEGRNMTAHEESLLEAWSEALDNGIYLSRAQVTRLEEMARVRTR
jgi:hypothetical protein